MISGVQKLRVRESRMIQTMKGHLHTSVDMHNRPELMDALNKYRISKGITWRRFVVLGMAAYIAEQGDAERLMFELIDYLNEVR